MPQRESPGEVTRETSIQEAGLPAEAQRRLRQAGVSTLEQVAEMGVSGLAALRLSVEDLRQTFAVMAGQGLTLQETPHKQSQRVTAALAPGVLRRDRDAEIVRSRSAATRCRT